jgi:hypothetical protein
LIEDAAEALVARYKGVSTGTFGDIGSILIQWQQNHYGHIRWNAGFSAPRLDRESSYTGAHRLAIQE